MKEKHYVGIVATVYLRGTIFEVDFYSFKMVEKLVIDVHCPFTFASCDLCCSVVVLVALFRKGYPINCVKENTRAVTSIIKRLGDFSCKETC